MREEQRLKERVYTKEFLKENLHRGERRAEALKERVYTEVREEQSL